MDFTLESGAPFPRPRYQDGPATSHLASLARRSVRRAVIQRVSFCPMKKRRKKIAVAGAVLLGAAIGLGAFWWNRPRPLRYPGYTLDLTLPTAAAAAIAAAPLRAGLGSADIPPTL